MILRKAVRRVIAYRQWWLPHSWIDVRQVVNGSEELLAGPLAQLQLGPLCGPLGAVHRSALRASGIVEEGEYVRELTKFYS